MLLNNGYVSSGYWFSGIVTWFAMSFPSNFSLPFAILSKVLDNFTFSRNISMKKGATCQLICILSSNGELLFVMFLCNFESAALITELCKEITCPRKLTWQWKEIHQFIEKWWIKTKKNGSLRLKLFFLLLWILISFLFHYLVATAPILIFCQLYQSMANQFYIC